MTLEIDDLRDLVDELRCENEKYRTEAEAAATVNEERNDECSQNDYVEQVELLYRRYTGLEQERLSLRVDIISRLSRGGKNFDKCTEDKLMWLARLVV